MSINNPPITFLFQKSDVPMLWITFSFAHSPLFFPCVWTTHFIFYTQRCGKTVPLFYTIPKKWKFRSFDANHIFFIRRKSTAHKSYTQGYQQLVDNFLERDVEIVE